MKKLIFLALIFCSFPFSIFSQQTFPVNGPHDIKQGYFAFVNATIYVDAQTKIEKASLVIKNGKIENVGVGISIPTDAKIMDLKGKFIYPSFIDLYSNYGLNWKQEIANRQFRQDRGQQPLSDKQGAYNWNEAIRSELNSVDFFSVDEKKAKQYLENGFGTVLTGIQDGICRGSSALVLLNSGKENENILTEKAAVGFSFNKGSSSQDYPGSMMGSIALIRQTYYDAHWYKNVVGVETNISLNAFNQLQNLPQIFEVENKLSALRAKKIADEFAQTYIIKGAGDEYQRLDDIKNLKTAFIIPVNFPKVYEVEDVFDAQMISLTDLKHWEMAPANLKMLSNSGVEFAITSQNSGDDFLKNIRKAIRYGLSEQAALKALTETPAKLIKANSQIGTLKKGMLANFFISNKNVFDKEALILENWVSGKKNTINEMPAFDVRGNYKIELKGFENYLMKIDADVKKPQVTLYGVDTIKASYQSQFNIISISFKENKKSEKNIRLSLLPDVIENLGDTVQQVKKISGQAQLADGTFSNFSATWIDAVKEKNIRKKDSVQTIEWGEIIYPFTDYGSKSIAQSETIVFKNATVWSNESAGIIKETDVAISNGKIVEIGKNIVLPNSKIIDASGKHLTSGIIDEHSHIAIYRGVNECTQAITSEVRIADVINSEDVNIYRQLAGGVIGAHLLHGSCNPIGGQTQMIKLRWGLLPEKMKFENADGYIKFALGENVKQSNAGDRATSRYPQTRMGVEQVYYDAFIRAKEYQKKIIENPTLTRKDLELDALVEILNKKRFITCHSYVQSEINMLIHAADSLGFKVNTFTHILEGYKVADKMKAHGACASTFADWWAYKHEVAEAIPYNAAIMNKVGLTVAINSDDTEMGRRLNQEAAKTIKYGNLSEEEAWKMVTLNPAKMMHIDTKTGSIKVGKDADLVLWSDNPLSIYAKTEMTLVDGICYFSLAKDEQLRKYIREERQRLINKMIAAKLAGEKTEKKVSEANEEWHCEDH